MKYNRIDCAFVLKGCFLIYGESITYNYPDAGGNPGYTGDFLYYLGAFSAHWPVGGIGTDFLIEAFAAVNGVLCVDYAGHTANAAAFVCLFCPAYGGNYAAGYCSGSVGLCAELCGLFCRDFPGWHSGHWPGPV